MRFSKFLVLAALLCVASLSWADLTGSTVSGQFNIGGFGSVNFFDPANGFVPPGCGNSASPTTTIGPGIEFCFNDGANADDADFTGTQLTITDLVESSGPNRSFVMKFNDDLFAGLTELSDSFPGGMIGVLNGNEIDVSWGGSDVDAGQMFTAVFDVNTAVPEPGSIMLFATGLAGVAGMIFRRRLR